MMELKDLTDCDEPCKSFKYIEYEHPQSPKLDKSDHHKRAASKLKLLCFISSTYVLAELFMSARFNSLSLLSDGVHNMSDVFSLLIALFMHRLGNREYDEDKYPYGYKRAEVLGGLINSLSLGTLCIYIALSSIPHLFLPDDYQVSWPFVGVTACGIFLNAFGVLLLIGNDKKAIESSDSSTDSITCSDVESGDASDQLIDAPSSRLPSFEVAMIHHKSTCQSPEIDTPHQHYHDNETSCGSDHSAHNAVEHSCSSQPWYAHSHNHHGHLHGDNHSNGTNMNLWAIIVHSAVDAFSSAIICVSAIVVKLCGKENEADWTDYLDPLISIMLSSFAVLSVFPIIKDCIQILLEGTPTNINLNLLKKNILTIDGVIGIESLAVMKLNSREPFMGTAKLVYGERHSPSTILADCRSILNESNIRYSTIELLSEKENSAVINHTVHEHHHDHEGGHSHAHCHDH